MKKINFVGIDDWNRPVFTDEKKVNYYGSTEILFEWGDTEETVLKKVGVGNLTYFGRKFNCEPMGDDIQNDIEIVRTI